MRQKRTKGKEEREKSGEGAQSHRSPEACPRASLKFSACLYKAQTETGGWEAGVSARVTREHAEGLPVGPELHLGLVISCLLPPHHHHPVQHVRQWCVPQLSIWDLKRKSNCCHLVTKAKVTMTGLRCSATALSFQQSPF